MNEETKKVIELVQLFCYILSPFSTEINKNTLERYIYLYLVSKSFLADTKSNTDFDSITILVRKSGPEIMEFINSLNELNKSEFIEIKDESIIIKENLINNLKKLIDNNGIITDKYLELLPFLNLIRSYNDNFIFTIFFSEPTFEIAEKRNEKNITYKTSKLYELLSKFKNKLKNSQIDEYDILTHWMNYILKNYYKD